MLHMLDPYVPLFSNTFQMLDFGIFVRCSWMFQGFGKVFVDIYLLFGNVGYILLIVYSTPLYNKPHTYGWYEGGLLRKGCCGKVNLTAPKAFEGGCLPQLRNTFLQRPTFATTICMGELI